MMWCPATRRECDQPCVGSNCLRLNPRVVKATSYRECPRCSWDAPGKRVGARMSYVCDNCAAKFWAPAVVIEVAADVVSERTRPLRKRDRLI